MTDFLPYALAGLVVVVTGIATVILAGRVLLDRGFAERFLGSFAATACAHYTEQAIRMVAGTALIVYAPAMRFTTAFSVFGWIVVVTTTGLLLVPWRWHHRFADRVVPWVIRNRKLYAGGLFSLGAILLYAVLDGPDERDLVQKPAIVEVFACSDYCPGPEEQYVKHVYEGVSDEAECRALGGEPYTYYGWGEFTVCLAGAQ